MFFRKKKEEAVSQNGALGDDDDGSPTGEYKLALDALDETVEQKKTVRSTVQKLAQKLNDSAPPPRRKPSTA